MPHQRTVRANMLCQPFLANGRARAFARLFKQGKRLAVGLKELVVRSVFAVQPQRNRHRRAVSQKRFKQPQHLAARAIHTVDKDGQAGNERFRQQFDGGVHRVVRAQVPFGKIRFGFPVENGKIAELFRQRQFGGQFLHKRVQRVRRDARALAVLKDAKRFLGKPRLLTGITKDFQLLALCIDSAAHNHAAALRVQKRLRLALQLQNSLAETLKAEHLHTEEPAQRIRKQTFRFVGILLRNDQDSASAFVLNALERSGNPFAFTRCRPAEQKRQFRAHVKRSVCSGVYFIIPRSLLLS